MRELASAGAWRGLTLGQIARRCNELHNNAIQQSNVRRFFESKSPRGDTIELLRNVVGLSDRHVRLASGERLRDNQYRAIDRNLRLRLAIWDTRFDEGTVARALTAYEQLDADQRAQILNAYELQCQRVDAMMVPLPPRDQEFDRNDPLVAFAETLHRFAGFDMMVHARRFSANEDTLWHIQVTLTLPWSPFTEHDADAIIATAIGLLRQRNIDTAPMEEHLRRQRAAYHRAHALANKREQEKT